MKSNLSLFMILLLISANLSAQVLERNRSISKAFYINKNTEVQVTNKYGNIQVINWNKDSVRLEINIEVSGNKISKVNNTFAEINVEFSGNQYYVVASTIFKNEKNNFWSDVTDITNSIFKGGNDTKINYIIYMPESNPLKINNKFGNIYLENRSATTELDLSNGDLKANEFSGFLRLNFSYGLANIKKIDKARMTLNYGEFQIGTANELTLNSKSTSLHCTKLISLQLDSKRDKLYLGEIGSINGVSSFSYVQLDLLQNSMMLKTNFGDLIINNIKSNFSQLNIISANTDIDAVFASQTSYKLDIFYTKRTKVIFPFTYEKLKKESMGKDGEETRITGTVGTNTKTNSNVIITQKSGSLSFSHKEN